MALSDTCADVLDTLATDLIHYSTMGYDPKELSKIITAMYELSSFMVTHDMPPDVVVNNLNMFLDNCVVDNLLQKAEKSGDNDFPEVLAGIARHNLRLKQGINNLINQLSNKDNTFELLKDSKLYDQLCAIKRESSC